MMKMNGAIEADLLLNCTDMSVLDRQRAHLGYHHPAFESGFFSDFDGFLGETTLESDARFKKRKFDTETKDCNENNKKMKITEQNNGSTKHIKKMKNKEQENCSNDSSKVTKELQKTDYIHVRARRGQATDSHSIAERVRREKISERMKFLQDLVPGCDKVTGKAGMLDEIINYVQSLQRQVEFLSMKLAAVSPRPDFDMDDIFRKQVVSTPMTNLANIVMPSHEMVNSGYLPFNPIQQVVTTNSDPLSCFNNGQAPSMWDSDVQNLYSTLGV